MALLVLALVVGMGVVKWKYGLGRLYPDVTLGAGAASFETLVQLEFPPGNVAVEHTGRIFFGYHPFAKAARFSAATVFELVGGVPQPFPDAEFQSKFRGVFGMTIDARQRLWLVEQAAFDHDRTRVLAFDIATRKLVFEHWFAKGDAQFAQDLRVSPEGGTVYLADTGFYPIRPASLIVLDVASKSYRSLMQTEAAAQPQDWVIQTRFGQYRFAYGLVRVAVGLDGIALDRDGTWLYFGAMSHDTMCRVSTAAVHGKIERVGRKPLSDGIAMDTAGNLLITDIEHGAIVRMGSDGALRTVAKSEKVIWADGLAIEPDGSILLTDSALPAYMDPLGRPPALEKLRAGAPYQILRVRPQ